jgi:hypothetical protein
MAVRRFDAPGLERAFHRAVAAGAGVDALAADALALLGRELVEPLGADAARARLPDGYAAGAVRFVNDERAVPIERRPDGTAWVAGSMTSTREPPIRVRVEIIDDTIWLTLGFCWSIWTDPGSPGRALVDRVAALLTQAGWSDTGLSGENPPPPEFDADPAPSAPVAAAQTLDGGRIVLVERLELGTADEVWTATVAAGGRALVTLTPRHLDGAPAPRALSFPGVVAIVFHGPPDPGVPAEDALVEALPDGRPAAARAPIAEAVLVRLATELARIAAAAHAAGEVVDGFRPELVYVDANGAFTGLVPRGPAFIASADQPHHGMRSYRVPFVAPERFSPGAPATREADVFSLCATVFAIGAGRHPYGDDEHSADIVVRMVSGPPDPWPGSAALGELLARGMAADPAQRPRAAELARALAALGE